jgi:uncharacterized MAPEG superfamily protein
MPSCPCGDPENPGDATMTIELWILLGAALLGLVHLSAASFAFKAQVGNRYTVGPRDESLQPVGLAGRLHRAQQNFLETFAIFATAVVLVDLTGAYGSFSYWGSILYLTGRSAFLPLYAMGVPWLRTFSWNLATLGLVLVGLQVVLGNR